MDELERLEVAKYNFLHYGTTNPEKEYILDSFTGKTLSLKELGKGMVVKELQSLNPLIHIRGK
jgi:hypothetical protein